MKRNSFMWGIIVLLVLSLLACDSGGGSSSDPVTFPTQLAGKSFRIYDDPGKGISIPTNGSLIIAFTSESVTLTSYNRLGEQVGTPSTYGAGSVNLTASGDNVSLTLDDINVAFTQFGDTPAVSVTQGSTVIADSVEYTIPKWLVGQYQYHENNASVAFRFRITENMALYRLYSNSTNDVPYPSGDGGSKMNAIAGQPKDIVIISDSKVTIKFIPEEVNPEPIYATFVKGESVMHVTSNFAYIPFPDTATYDFESTTDDFGW